MKKAAQKQYQSHGVHAFFKAMLEAATRQYNWGYLDSWAHDLDLRMFWVFMVWRMQCHGRTDQLVEEEISARIQLINQSLHGLDYQVGTFIELDRVSSPDVEIREFKQRLKQCVEHTLDDNLYSEQKFEQVKSLIEQMRQDPKWTQKVVDVRFRHLFNVIERYREDGSEKECYSDSGGKSGGQKEKLAYSILAAAILLQYRLVGDTAPSGRAERRFNLVVIDEAFARGSKDSTRFGLELFRKLGLQLLLVTPLQKLDVIEHYVRHVHFVDQKQNRSMLLNMTIEEYRQRLAQHQALSTYTALVTEVK